MQGTGSHAGAFCTWQPKRMQGSDSISWAVSHNVQGEEAR